MTTLALLALRLFLASPLTCGTAQCTTEDSPAGWITVCERDGVRWIDAYGDDAMMRARDMDGAAWDCPSETYWDNGDCISCAEMAADPFWDTTYEECEASR